MATEHCLFTCASDTIREVAAGLIVIDQAGRLPELVKLCNARLRDAQDHLWRDKLDSARRTRVGRVLASLLDASETACFRAVEDAWSLRRAMIRDAVRDFLAGMARDEARTEEGSSRD